nr:MAG TPA: hypothetical protein [Caudoviricetes sp.]
MPLPHCLDKVIVQRYIYHSILCFIVSHSLPLLLR